jgi:hypothetical protein
VVHDQETERSHEAFRLQLNDVQRLPRRRELAISAPGLPGAAGAVVRLVCTLVLRELAAVVAR